jgi:hypothetical protein
MTRLRLRFLITVVAIAAAFPALADAQKTIGSLEVNVKNVKADGKPIKLSRKRFYLFKGGLTENAALLQRIEAAEITSRNCYYKGQQASSQYICWLQAENCETPFCRVVEPRFIDQKDPFYVPEFLAAYNKGFTLYKKPDVARKWIIPNMPDNLVNGYYLQQQKVLAGVLGSLKFVQSSMIDTSSTKTVFLDLPFIEGSETKVKYLVSNVLPIEIGDKSYVWTCERDAEAGKKIILDMSKTGKNCVTTVRTIKNCETVACEDK